jgi:hypothetical protein
LVAVASCWALEVLVAAMLTSPVLSALCLSRRKDLFPYKHPAIIVRKDGKMLVAMAYFEPIRSPNAWFYNHVIVWYNQFRPFDPVKIE